MKKLWSAHGLTVVVVLAIGLVTLVVWDQGKGRFRDVSPAPGGTSSAKVTEQSSPRPEAIRTSGNRNRPPAPAPAVPAALGAGLM